VDEDFPEEIRKIATSLRMETGINAITRGNVLGVVLGGIERHYRLLCEDGFGQIREDLLRYSLLMGKIVKVAVGTGHVEGVAQDIDVTGALVVRKDNGTLERIMAGEVVRIA
jgi:BirA family biotin operon repressor/biotin-[acetyl-CoA-carboxylase] ligase